MEKNADSIIKDNLLLVLKFIIYNQISDEKWQLSKNGDFYILFIKKEKALTYYADKENYRIHKYSPEVILETLLTVP